MFSREFEYTGYDGKPKKDTYWFNLTEAELYEIDLSSIHGFTGEMNKLLKEDFYRSKAYSQLFVELVSSGEKVAEFLKGAIPDEIRVKMEEAEKEQEAAPEADGGKVLNLPDVPKRNDAQ